MSTLGGIAAALTLFLVQSLPLVSARAQTTTYYYWVAPDPLSGRAKPESFVVALDSMQAAQADSILAAGRLPIVGGNIAAGSVPYNKNYHAPGHPVWNWYFRTATDVFDPKTTYFPACECPNLIANPSDIAADPAAWIATNRDRYSPLAYRVTSRIDQTKKDAVANVSNRGLTGSGEKNLITGFILTGGEPRTLIVRALGPSLSQSGLQQVCTNPKIDVFQGSKRLFGNTDWKTDARMSQLSQNYPFLSPTNDKEAALLLTLMPGAYTVVSGNEDGGDGVVLVEVYDADSG